MFLLAGVRIFKGPLCYSFSFSASLQLFSRQTVVKEAAWSNGLRRWCGNPEVPAGFVSSLSRVQILGQAL